MPIRKAAGECGAGVFTVHRAGPQCLFALTDNHSSRRQAAQRKTNDEGLRAVRPCFDVQAGRAPAPRPGMARTLFNRMPVAIRVGELREPGGANGRHVRRRIGSGSGSCVNCAARGRRSPDRPERFGAHGPALHQVFPGRKRTEYRVAGRPERIRPPLHMASSRKHSRTT